MPGPIGGPLRGPLRSTVGAHLSRRVRNHLFGGGSGRGVIVPIVIVGLAVCLLLPLVALGTLVGMFSGTLGVLGGGAGCDTAAPKPSVRAESSIPPDYLRLYQQAGRHYSVPWNLLAAVGRVETNHGRLEASGVHSGTNFAGAAGPMQFLRGTWQRYAVDGDHDGSKDIYDPGDAIPTAAHYLSALGAPENIAGAIFGYNHAQWYVQEVLGWAKRYASGRFVMASASTQLGCITQAVADAPSALVGKVVAFARAQLGKPYVWGTEGPHSFDCSGLTLSAYAYAGIHIPRVSRSQWSWGPHVPDGHERPGDLVFFGYDPADPSTIHHVGIVIGGGKMIEAPHTGAFVEIESYKGRGDIVGFTRPAAHAGTHGRA